MALGATAFDPALPIVSLLLKAQMAESKVRSIALKCGPARCEVTGVAPLTTVTAIVTMNLCAK